MKKTMIIFTFVLAFFLSSCGKSDTVYNFKVRKDDYFINENGSVIVDYKTNENGLLVKLNIDRLLTIEDMIYLNPNVDYNVSIEGYLDDVYTNPGVQCTTYNFILVPVNIEVGNTRLKYDSSTCNYKEVDRNNDYKTGTYIRTYSLLETMAISKDIVVSVVIYDENSIEKFIKVLELPHTVKQLGVYSIAINNRGDDYLKELINYYNDIAIYEQLVLKYQENEQAVLEALGITSDINLLDFDLTADLVPMIENFEIQYAQEITAITELEAEIGVVVIETIPVVEE